MIDSIVKIIGHLLALSKSNQDLKRRNFEDHVQPAFETLKLVIKDYREMFDRTSAMVEDETVAPEAVRTELKRQRSRYQDDRFELRTNAEVIINAQFPSQVDRFANGVLKLLTMGPSPPVPRSVWMMDLVYEWSQLLSADAQTAKRPQVVDAIKEEREHVERAWEEVVFFYNQARVELLK